ncbi:MAG: alpha/beta hydrolase [Sandaracinaceae bacterium]|nr:alpha/beta hydrolase [Sandaracinaceae bacterium]
MELAFEGLSRTSVLTPGVYDTCEHDEAADRPSWIPEIPPAILADRRVMYASSAGLVGCYVDESGEGRPLVLLHSMHLAASAYEVMPLFMSERGKRPVYAVELPGFGSSDRSERIYDAAMMMEALFSVLSEIVTQRGMPVDVVALGNTGEMVARVASAAPYLTNSLTLVAPTVARMPMPLRTRLMQPAAHLCERLLLSSGLGPLAFRLLTSRMLMRAFYASLFGSVVDEGLLAYARITSRARHARFAPACLIGGRLRCAETLASIFARVPVRTLLVCGARDVMDETLHAACTDNAHVSIARIDGAHRFPHFENPEAFHDAMTQFQTLALG